MHCWQWAIWGRDGGPVAATLGVDGHQSGTLFAFETSDGLAIAVTHSDDAVRAMIAVEAAA